MKACDCATCIDPERGVRARLMSRMRITESGCWEWTGTKRRGGYGQISVHSRQRKTHRLAYELFIGPIADGLLICHHCDNPPCFNPQHIYAGTPLDNGRDMAERRRRLRETCFAGHPLTKDNVVRPDAGGAGFRRCKACRRETQRAWKLHQREQRLAQMSPEELARFLRQTCRNGHEMTPKNTEKGGRCVECRRAYQREQYAANPEPYRQAQRDRVISARHLREAS